MLNPIRLLRRLLELDRAFPALSDAEVAAEVERLYPWNFWTNLFDGANFWFGSTFISAGTILALFISKLTPDPRAVGVMAAIAQAGWFLPQLFTAGIVERLPRKKAMVVNLGLVLERLPVALLAIAPLLAVRNPRGALALALGALTWHVVGAGVVAISWQDMLAKIIPLNRRGRFFGLTNAVGTIMGFAAAVVSAQLLDKVAYPMNFFYCFVLAACFITLSWISLSLVREPPQPVTTPRPSFGAFWKRLPEIIKRDHNFTHFMIARLCLALATMGSSFLAISAIQRWNLGDSAAGYYTLAALIGQATGNLLFGFLADRFGHVRNLVFGALASALAFLLAWLAPTPAWNYGVFVLNGIGASALLVSGIMVVMEFSSAELRPTYLGLSNTGTGIAGLIAPLIGGVLAKNSYALVFISSAVIGLLGCALMALWVHDPRWAKPETANTQSLYGIPPPEGVDMFLQHTTEDEM